MARSLIDGGGPTPVAKAQPKSTTVGGYKITTQPKSTYRPLPSATPTTGVVQQKESMRNPNAPVGLQGWAGLAELDARGDYNAVVSPHNPANIAMRNALAAGGGGGGGYGGGGGGGGAAGPTQATFDAYMAALQKLLAVPTIKATVHPLTGKIDPAVAKDIAAAQKAFAAIPKAAPNPYAGLTFDAPTLSPELARFIQSQGGDVGAYQNQVAASNVGLGSSAANWDALARTLGANYNAAVEDYRRANDTQRAVIENALRAMGTEMNAAVAMQQAKMNEQAAAEQRALEQARQQALAQALSAGLQYGFTPPKGF